METCPHAVSGSIYVHWMDDNSTQARSGEKRPGEAQDGTSVKRELYRNATGHEVWRIYEERSDGSFLVLHEDVASDHDMAWLTDAAGAARPDLGSGT
jgi:hypothetical protein